MYTEELKNSYETSFMYSQKSFSLKVRFQLMERIKSSDSESKRNTEHRGNTTEKYMQQLMCCQGQWQHTETITRRQE